MPQCNDISMLLDICFIEDSLVYQPCGVGVYEVVSLLAQHEEIGTVEGRFGGDDVRQLPEKKNILMEILMKVL